ncbi:hypothetical protein C0J52_22210 [Blattella germanica]|nr:hypothetical protein C0J52_22210 [Blattella germanica]
MLNFWTVICLVSFLVMCYSESVDVNYVCMLNVCTKTCNDTGEICVQNKVCQSTSTECLDIECITDCSNMTQFVVYEIYKNGLENRTATTRDKLIDFYFSDIIGTENEREVQRLLSQVPKTLFQQQYKMFNPNLINLN